jgi:putative transposase
VVRLNRIHIRNAVVYVVIRGRKDAALLVEQRDCERLESLIRHALVRCRSRLLAFCWLPNAAHLVIRLTDVPLESLMRRVSGPYSRYLHHERHWHGRIYQSRYRAVVIDADAYLLALLQYVHLLPVTDGLCADPGDYPRTSHRAYRDGERVAWLAKSEILEALGQRDRNVVRAYRTLMNAPLNSRIIAQFEHGSRTDSRVVGGFGFVGIVERKSVGRRASLPADEILAAVCRWQNVTPAQLFSRSISRQGVLVRSLVAWHISRRGGTNLAELARQFGVRRWTLRSAIERHRTRRPDLFSVPLNQILAAVAGMTDGRPASIEESEPPIEESEPPIGNNRSDTSRRPTQYCRTLDGASDQPMQPNRTRSSALGERTDERLP